MKKYSRELILKEVRNHAVPAVQIKDSTTIADFARAFYDDDLTIYESAFVILLNHANKTIGWAKIGQGGICSTVVDVKLICKYAIESLSSAVVFVHNHPTGNTQPSGLDDTITRRIKDALKIMDVRLLDSVIITEESHYSYFDNGRL